MDPQERLRLRLVGTTCAACGGSYRASGIRVLAQREDLAFVLLHCGECGSDGLGLVTDGSPDGATEAGALDHDGDRRVAFGELTPGDVARLRDAEPIAVADVLAVREYLRTYRGDLRDLLGESRPGTGDT